jgi:[acyl-carrier-protein] S-malonyltransferase
MDTAKEILKGALDNTNIYNARIPVYANVSAKPVLIIEEIKKSLYEQVTSPVRWEETINNMINDGIDEFYEIGPGKVLQGLVKRINSDVKYFGIDKYSDVEKYI